MEKSSGHAGRGAMVVGTGGQNTTCVISGGLKVGPVTIVVDVQALFHHSYEGGVEVDVFLRSVEALALLHRQLNAGHLDTGGSLIDHGRPVGWCGMVGEVRFGHGCASNFHQKLREGGKNTKKKGNK